MTTPRFLNLFLLILLYSGLLVAPSLLHADEPVEWYLELADPNQDFEPMDEFEVIMGIRKNNTGLRPAGFNVALSFPQGDLEFVSSGNGTGGWRPGVGTNTVEEREINGRTMLVTTQAFFATNINSSRPSEPIFGRLRFRIRPNPTAPVTFILIERFGTNPSNWLIGTDGMDLPPIPFEFQFTQTEAIALDGVEPTPTPT
ncbi:MAG: hypothetical protein JJU11_05010, partial [Candidatus Sumerlaeia bacterium]|nr:hypothetical protein [Candidatus Sumerlaeia bacterium]